MNLRLNFREKNEILYRLKQKGYARIKKQKSINSTTFYQFYMHIIRLIANNLNEKR